MFTFPNVSVGVPSSTDRSIATKRPADRQYRGNPNNANNKLVLILALLSLPVCCQSAGFFDAVERFIKDVEDGAKNMFGARPKDALVNEEGTGRLPVTYTFTSMTDFWAFGSKTNALNGPKKGDILILKNQHPLITRAIVVHRRPPLPLVAAGVLRLPM
jgi:hypothetical protein